LIRRSRTLGTRALDEARRIAANIAELPGLRGPYDRFCSSSKSLKLSPLRARYGYAS
jgi:hypothetical protein